VEGARRAVWRLLWVGPATVIVGVGAVVIVQLAALRMVDWPRPSPFTTHEPAIFTAVLVSGAVIVFMGVLLEAVNPVRTFRRIALVTLALSGA